MEVISNDIAELVLKIIKLNQIYYKEYKIQVERNTNTILVTSVDGIKRTKITKSGSVYYINNVHVPKCQYQLLNQLYSLL